MHSFKRVLCVAVAAQALSWVAASSAPAAPPVEVFGNLPQEQYGRISPDGRYLAIVQPINGHNSVVVYDLSQTGTQPQPIAMNGAIVGRVAWKSDDTIVVQFHANVKRKVSSLNFSSRNFETSERAVAVNMTTKKPALLMSDAPWFSDSSTAIVDMDAGEPGYIYMSELDRKDVNLVVDLYRVSLATGHASQILGGAADTYRFITDGYGHVLGRVDQDWDLTEHLTMGGQEVMKYSAKGGDGFALDGLLAGNNAGFVAEGWGPTGTVGLYSWTPNGGFGSAVWENPNYDMESAIEDEHDQRIIGARWTEDLQKTKYFDPAMQHVQDTLENAFPGLAVTIVSKDATGKTYVFQAEGPKNPPILYLYTTANHHVDLIQEAYPQLKAADLGDVKRYDYKSSDGLDIRAYLTLPPGKGAKNLPLVVFPHGGPEGRDSMEFDWWAQFMASRGYAVLQPNFRGSSGYGKGFVRAGDGEWAGKVQDDVQFGVKKLIAEGIVDPKKICIVGASYGGYMALAGASFSPDLYTCAISYAGISDLNYMVSQSSFESVGSSLWRRRIGADKDSSKLASASPVNFAGKVKIPVLLIHSEKDATVPIDQSEIEESALKRAGKQVEFVRLDGDDHYLELADARIKLLKEVDRFLAANLGK
jgi:dienelactone hydrolase